MAEVSFGEWLKRRRGAQGWTQKQLAQQIHCSLSALRKMEAEERRPSPSVVDRLADIFNIPQEERKAFLRFTHGDWQAISSGDQEEAPWRGSPVRLETISSTRHNLPLQLSSFIGREKEQAEIRVLVGKNRLVTLAGAGGIGKTRIAIQAASTLLNNFPDGIWLVEFAPLSDPALVPKVVAVTLGLIEQANRPPQHVLIDFLQAKKSLLILDNCEHLIQTCAQLTDTLLRACPALHILATSREGLGTAGEAIYLVPSLTLPDQMEMTPEVLTQYEAVQLFVERAQTALPGFTMTRDNASAIAQVCRQLDGIPLALELAAARVKLLNVEEIAARLDDAFRLLTGGVRTALPRHQTLQELIDWSHELLSESEHVLFRRLSIFAGGWTLKAAESVCTDEAGKDPVLISLQDGILSHQVLDLLTSLLNKSLILAEHKDGQETHYHMLETIRQYAHEKLWAVGEGESLCQRHLAYFVKLAEHAEPNLRAFEMVAWLDQLEAVHDNIRSALEYAQESNIESQLRLASALLWFWHIRGHKNEGIEWLERALSIEALDRNDQPMLPARALIRGKALNASGSLMVMNNEYGRAPVRLNESLAIFKGLGPAGNQGMGYALLRLGSIPTDNDQQWSMLEQSLALFREIGDTFGAAECLMQLAGIAHNRNEHERASRLTEEQLALSRKIGDRDGIAVALTIQGDIALSQGNHQRASVLYQESIQGFRAMRNRGAEGLSLTGSGDVYFWQGAYRQAVEIYEEARSLAHDLGYKFLIALNMYNLGIIAWFQGEYARATELLTESRPIFRQVGHPWLIASSSHALGDIALVENDETAAARWYESELALSQEAQLKVIQAFGLEGLGTIAWIQGNYPRAAQYFEEGLKISHAANAKPAIFRALYRLGRTAQSQGDTATAQAYYGKALEIQRLSGSALFNWTGLKTYHSSVAYPLAAFALLAAMQNKMALAACLFSVAEILYAPLRFEMSAKERAEHDHAVGTARAALGGQAFSVAYAKGRAMTLGEAVTLALSEN